MAKLGSARTLSAADENRLDATSRPPDHGASAPLADSLGRLAAALAALENRVETRVVDDALRREEAATSGLAARKAGEAARRAASQVASAIADARAMISLIDETMVLPEDGADGAEPVRTGAIDRDA